MIEIDEGAAAANGLEDVILLVDPSLDDRVFEAGLPGYIHKVRMERQPRRLAARLGFHIARCDTLRKCRMQRGGRQPRELRKESAANHVFLE
jgi:hypothetical protein